MSVIDPPEVSPRPHPDESLAARVAELEAVVEQLTRRLGERPTRAPGHGSPARDEGAGSLGRRALLGRIGVVAAVGAGGALATGALAASPAAAANFDPVLAGTNATATNTTGFTSTSAFATMSVQHQLDSQATSLFVGRGGTSNTGQAIYCNNDSTHEDASSLDVRMGTAGAKGPAIYAFNNGSGVSLEARSNGGHAISAQGTRAGIRLTPLNSTGPAAAGLRGELRMDAKADLYLCTADALPGIFPATWRRVTTASPGYDNGSHAGSVGSSGSLNLLEVPFRLFDSRPGQPVPLGGGGKLAPASNVDVKVTGTVPNGGGRAVPVGAVGVLVGLTVTGTSGAGGFLKAFPTGAPVPNTSVINWFGANQNLAVTTFVRLDAAGRFTLRAGTAATHALVDVVGFVH